MLLIGYRGEWHKPFDPKMFVFIALQVQGGGARDDQHYNLPLPTNRFGSGEDKSLAQFVVRITP
jgi:hypothetical protein